jgi:hypothetical protein
MVVARSSKTERAKISEAWFSPANLVDVVGRGREDVLGLFHERVGHLDALVQRLRLALPAALGLLPVGGFDCGRKKNCFSKKKDSIVPVLTLNMIRLRRCDNFRRKNYKNHEITKITKNGFQLALKYESTFVIQFCFSLVRGSIGM